MDVTKIGKYVIHGTLDSSNYPNPLELTLSQTVYVREPKNMVANPSFEEGAKEWGWGSNYESKLTPAVAGSYAVGVKSSKNAYTSYNMFYTSTANQTAMAERVQALGAGQYYVAAQVRDYQQAAEVTHTDSLQAFIQLRYKTDPEASSSSWKGETNVITLTDEYQTTSGVFTLTGEEIWLRTDFYLKSATAFADQWVMYDNVQFLPLNVTVATYEGTMERVETVIPVRNVIENYPDYVGPSYTNADLLLPETVDVRSSTGELITVDVIWNYTVVSSCTSKRPPFMPSMERRSSMACVSSGIAFRRVSVSF